MIFRKTSESVNSSEYVPIYTLSHAIMKNYWLNACLLITCLETSLARITYLYLLTLTYPFTKPHFHIVLYISAKINVKVTVMSIEIFAFIAVNYWAVKFCLQTDKTIETMVKNSISD